MSDPTITDKAVTEPVRVELNAEWPGGDTTETVEVDRAEWDTLTPAQRREMLEDDAQALLGDYASCGYTILGDDQGSDQNDPAALPHLADRTDTTGGQGDFTADEYRRAWNSRFDTLLAASDVLDADDQLSVLDVHEAVLAEQYFSQRVMREELAELRRQSADRDTETAAPADEFAGFYITKDDGYPALSFYPREDEDGEIVKFADAGTSLDELVKAAREHRAASLRGEE